MSLSVFARVSRNTERLSCLFLTHAYADSSILIRLETGCSSDRLPSETDKEGLGERFSGSKTLPLLAAAAFSESWLSMVAMNDPKAASVLALSSPKTLVSLDWISKYAAALETSPLRYPSTRALLDCPKSGPGPRGPGSGPDRPHGSEC